MLSDYEIEKVVNYLFFQRHISDFLKYFIGDI
jgi:hypothetical protein